MMIAQNVLQYIRDNHLVESRKILIVGVSGGPDSVCLLHILNGLRQELGTELHVAHLNHKLRRDESDGDAAYAAGLAEKLGLPVTVGERDVQEYRTSHGGTLEEAAREVRYAFFAELAQKLGTDAVATGHTRDDKIETILLHLVRGTGTRGLTGLRPETSLNTEVGLLTVIRPLLGITREETVAYCREYGLHPRQDSTNESLSPLRNRIRQQLLPLLESYNGGVKEALLRTSDIASDEMDFLEEVVADLWNRVAEVRGESVFIDKAKFAEIHPAIQRHVLRRAVELVLGTLKDIETRHIGAMLDGLTLQPGKELHLPGGLLFTVDYDRYVLTREPGVFSVLPELDGEYKVEVPGKIYIPGWEITATVHEPGQETIVENPFTAYFDLEKSGETLTVRSRKTADRFQPLGTDYLKKVGEYMIDAKISRSQRDRVPLVRTPEQIIWLAGYRIDDRVKITPETRKILRIEFRQTVVTSSDGGL